MVVGEPHGVGIYKPGSVVEYVEPADPVDLEEAAESAWRAVATGDASLPVGADPVIEADGDRVERLPILSDITVWRYSPSRSGEILYRRMSDSIRNRYRNAVEHGDPAVTVSTGDPDGGFFVAEGSPGIPGDAREDRFEARCSTASDGTGLGLDIVRQISEAHDWNVSAKESRDGGARFEITGVRRHD